MPRTKRPGVLQTTKPADGLINLSVRINGELKLKLSSKQIDSYNARTCRVACLKRLISEKKRR